jgi:hypothetical protein
MVERSKVYDTDQGEFLIRVNQGASDSDGANWVSSIHGIGTDVYDGYVGSYDTPIEALRAAQDKIGYVDRSEVPQPTSLTALYNDGRGIMRITTRSQTVHGQRQHRATITRQQSVIMQGNIYNDAVDAFDEAINFVLTDQSAVRGFAVNKNDNTPAQIYRIRLDRDGDRPNCTFTVFDPTNNEIYTSEVTYKNAHDAVLRATHWIVQNT